MMDDGEAMDGSSFPGDDMNMGGEPMDTEIGEVDVDTDEEHGNQFDTNFDAGVQADEENDPKRYIQQLTGKLSQSLRKYNSDLPQPDADLNKYVAGMIVKQAVDGLDDKDRNEIIKKVSEDNPGNDKKDNDDLTLDDIDNDEPQEGGNEGNEMPNNEVNPAMGEGVCREDMVNELLQDIKKDKNSEKHEDKPERKGAKGYKNRPY